MADTPSNRPSSFSFASAREGEMVETEHESENFAWRYDAGLGYGWILRKADGAESALMTGDDCVQIRRDFKRLRSKTGSPKYPKQAPCFSEIFDSIASDDIHDC